MDSSSAIQEELRALDFHDSALSVVSVYFSNGNGRSCVILIDYYDWEGNLKRREEEPAAEWTWKRLKITFGYLAHIEFSAPDFVNRAQDILSLTLGHGIESLRDAHTNFKSEFPQGTFPLFDDDNEVVSARFSTQNFGDDAEGYLWVAGSRVRLEWLGSGELVGQAHIPIADA